MKMYKIKFKVNNTFYQCTGVSLITYSHFTDSLNIKNVSAIAKMSLKN